MSNRLIGQNNSVNEFTLGNNVFTFVNGGVGSQDLVYITARQTRDVNAMTDATQTIVLERGVTINDINIEAFTNAAGSTFVTSAELRINDGSVVDLNVQSKVQIGEHTYSLADLKTWWESENRDAGYQVKGDEIDLTPVVTDDTATYEFNVVQNSFGVMVNTFGTGQKVVGTAKENTLNAELINNATVGGGSLAPRPQTENIQNVNITALDVSQNNTEVFLDAKNMVDVTYIGSYQSNADLTISDLTTKKSDGTWHEVQDMTIGMKFTSNAGTHQEAADLKVYFDQDYLLPSEIRNEGIQTIDLRMMNRDAEAYRQIVGEGDYGPLSGVHFSFFSFELAGQLVDLTSFVNEAEAALEGTATARQGTGEAVKTYQQAVNLLNTALDAWKASEAGAARLAEINAGLEENLNWNDLKFVLPANRPFTTTSSETETQLTGSIIELQGPVNSELTDLLNMTGDFFELGVSIGSVPGTHRPTDAQLDAAGLDDWASDRFERAEVTAADVQDDQELRINVELHKVGRASDGGELIIGGMSDGGSNTWTGDQSSSRGIEIFDITVLGSDLQSSSVSSISSTNNSLQEVNVKSSYTGDRDHANLTIGNMHTNDNSPNSKGTQAGDGISLKDVRVFNATEFEGNLDLNQAEITNETIDKYLNRGEVEDFEYFFGGGNDNLELAVDEAVLTRADFALDIRMGNGNNSVELNTGDTSFSLETTAALENLSVRSGNGADEIVILGQGKVDIHTGNGDDFVYINAKDSEGTDDAATGTWTLGDDSANSATSTFTARPLYKAELTLSFAGFEQTVEIETVQSRNFVATQFEINQAVKKAIAESDVLKHLLTASDGSYTELTIQSLVDGHNNLGITINQPELVTGTPDADNNEIAAPTGTALTALQRGLIANDVGAHAGMTDSDNVDVTDLVNGNIQLDGTANPANDYFDADDGNSADEATVQNESVINVGGGSSTVVLGSHNDSANTLVMDQSFGTISIVNFFDTAALDDVGDHLLDFTHWLTNKVTTANSNSTLSESRVATTVTTDETEFAANSVVITDFATLTGAHADNLNFATMTNAQVKAALTGENGGNATAFSGAAATAELVGTTRQAIMMVENDDNAGEYKVYHVEFDNSGTDVGFSSASLIGTLDFGNSVTGITTDLDGSNLV